MNNNIINKLIDDISSETSIKIDREIKDFLTKHNLPVDRDELLSKGFELIIEVRDMERSETENIVTLAHKEYVVKLVRVIDCVRLHISSVINVI